MDPSGERRGGGPGRDRAGVKRKLPSRVQPRRPGQRDVAARKDTVARTSDFAYNQIRGAVNRTASRIGLEDSRLARQAQQQLRETKRQWDEAERKIREYMRENPEKAAAIAAGVGVAIGAALATAMRRRSRR